MARCRVCRAEFVRKSIQHKCCSVGCAAQFAIREREAKERKASIAEMKARKERLKTRSDYLKEAQQAVNEYVRWRDRNEPCISCGRYHEGQWHAGHYRTTKAAPELRFNLLNIHKQCQPCNTHLSGNIVEYRINLIRKIGIEAVEWLEGPHEPLKLTIEQIKELRDEFRMKLREAKREERLAA